MDEEKVRVVAAVISHDGKYLICQRPWSKRHGGLWEFPGGKTEEDETDADAISRELREELGVRTVDVGTPTLSLMDPDSPFLIAFVPVSIEGAPSAREHLQIRWARVAELVNMPLAPSDRVFAQQLMDGGHDVS